MSVGVNVEITTFIYIIQYFEISTPTRLSIMKNSAEM